MTSVIADNIYVRELVTVDEERKQTNAVLCLLSKSVLKEKYR